MSRALQAPLLGLAFVAACGGGAGDPDASPPMFIDAATDPCAWNTLSCNLLTQTGCNPGEKCTWMRIVEECPSRPACVPEGDVPVGGPCSWGPTGPTTGYDDCVTEAICDDTQSPATCVAMCSLGDATLPCPAGFGCWPRPELFGNDPEDAPITGACEATCDPLTQIRNSDGAAACGSTNPAMPDRGCYGFPSTDASPTEFTCYPAGTLGHGEGALELHTNMCLPGAMPLLRESTGSMNIICIAMCAPLRINYNEPVEARDGAEPYSCPEMPLAVGVTAPARATGPNERCQHLWFWESDATPLTAASNAYGFCVDPARYTWDHDGMPATPAEPWPMPETLTPYELAQDPLSTQTDLFWGWAPYPVTP